MDTCEPKAHSFIVKIWLEEGDEAEKLFWRGQITHVPSGERRQLKVLSDVTDFIELYLAGTDHKLKRGASFRRLVRRLRFGSTKQSH
jgi:hypothetical protein